MDGNGITCLCSHVRFYSSMSHSFGTYFDHLRETGLVFSTLIGVWNWLFHIHTGLHCSYSTKLCLSAESSTFPPLFQHRIETTAAKCNERIDITDLFKIKTLRLIYGIRLPRSYCFVTTLNPER